MSLDRRGYCETRDHNEGKVYNIEQLLKRSKLFEVFHTLIFEVLEVANPRVRRPLACVEAALLQA